MILMLDANHSQQQNKRNASISIVTTFEWVIVSNWFCLFAYLLILKFIWFIWVRIDDVTQSLYLWKVCVMRDQLSSFDKIKTSIEISSRVNFPKHDMKKPQKKIPTLLCLDYDVFFSKQNTESTNNLQHSMNNLMLS